MMPEEQEEFTGVRLEIIDRGQVTRIGIQVPGISDMTKEEFEDFAAGIKAEVDEWFAGRRHG